MLRPEPGLAATLGAARALGLKVQGHALLQIVPVEWQPPDPAVIDALLIGSANVFVHGGAPLNAMRAKPVYVVGSATADAARAAGFAVAAQGEGGLQKVLDGIKAPLRLLRIAGEEHLALDVPSNITIFTRIAYRSEARRLDPALPVLAQDGITVLLHSAASARQFAMECERLGLDRARLGIAALGPRIASAVGTGWRAVHIASAPNDAALLEMVRDICDEA